MSFFICLALALDLLGAFAPLSQVMGAASTAWTQLSPSGTPPTARYVAAGAYDEANDRLIMFGGSYGTNRNDTWVLSGASGSPSAWTQLSPSGGLPPVRQDHSMVYDPVTNRAIVHGGCGGGCAPALSDTWVLTNANGLGGTPTWSSLTSAPVARASHAAVYDAANNRMIIFGGLTGSTGSDRNDVWVLTYANGLGGTPAWTQLSPTGTPPGLRTRVSGVYDAANNRMIIFGGATTSHVYYNDVWVLTNANGLGGTPAWIQLSPTGTPPNARAYSENHYDAANNRLIVFGGHYYSNPTTTFFNDVWVLINANGLSGTPQWFQLTPTGTPPAARTGAVSGYAQSTHTLIIMGGNDITGPLNDAWTLSDANELPLTVNSTNDVDDGTCSPAPGHCSLREAINAANTYTGADTIDFAVSGTIALGSTLPAITSEMTIDGSGQTVAISGADLVRVFYVTSTGKLTLDTITVQDGNAGAGNGGGIENDGSLTVINSAITGNNATVGGGISSNFGFVTLTDSTLSENTGGAGGAINTADSTLTITDTTFTNNSATNHDGAIRIWSGSVTVSGSTFDSNRATSGIGGGLSVYGGTLDIDDSTITGNSAGDSCGGIAVISYRVALGNLGGTAHITNSTISGNSAGTNGGGVCIQTAGNGVATITDSTLSGNSASINGGGIYNLAAVTISSSLVTDNHALDASSIGGGLFNGGGLTVTNSTVSLNTAYGGAGLFNSSPGTATISSSTFSENDASVYGGGVANSNGANLTLSNATISDNSAVVRGGGLYSFSSTEYVTQSTFYANSGSLGGNLFKDVGTLNLAGTVLHVGTTGSNCYRQSGTIANNGYNLSDDNSCGFSGTSVNNAALNLGTLTDNGGPTLTHLPGAASMAIDRIPAGTTITNGSVSYTCEQDGEDLDSDQRGEPRPAAGGACDAGAVEAYDLACNAITTGTRLSECIQWANLTPGAQTLDLSADITLSAALTNVTSEITINGHTHFVSGADLVRVFYVASTGSLTLERITVKNGNSHAGYGGGVYNAGLLNVNNSTLSGNSSNGGGGGIYNGGTLNVTNSVVTGNTTFAGGAGILNWTPAATVTITNSVISDNEANSTGGGLYNNYDGLMTITGSTISGNSAGYSHGGASNAATLTIIDSTFSNNSTTNNGGAIGNNGTLTVVNSTFSGNSANNVGGSFSLLTGSATILHSTISGNSAANGGGIFNLSTLNLGGSILDTGTTGANCSGTIIDNGYNLSDDTSCAFSGTGSQNNVTLHLSPLTDNGGPTLTHLPLLGNPAIDGGDNATCAALPVNNLDQRGQARPFDGNGDGTATCDIGAVERRITVPSLSINNVTHAEGNSGTTTFTFTVTRTGATDGTSTVHYATADGTATVSDGDYVVASGTLAFATGDTEEQITVTVNGDTKLEPGETFTVELSAPTFATITDDSGLGTIQNDDSQPTIRIDDVTVTEGNSGTTDADFTVSLTNGSSSVITVQYATANGSATAPADYTTTSGTLTFNPGEPLTQTVTVPVIGDTITESDETFTVTLSDPTNATLADAQGAGTITNDDPVPGISINDVTVTEGDSGTTDAVFTVSLTNGSSSVITVQYATANGSATAPADYTTTSGTLTFNPGAALSQTVTVPIVGDTICENLETFTVSLSGPTNANLADGSGTGTITDDDLCPPTLLTPPDGTLTNDNTPTFTWQPVPDAVMYRIQVEDEPVFTASPLIDAVVNGPAYTPVAPLTDNVTYWWRVQAIDGGGQTSLWSSTWHFTIDPLRLAAPGLNNPKDHTATADTTPAFSWKSVKGAVMYEFQFADDYGFGSPLVDIQTIARSYTLPIGRPYGVYFWRVRAQDAAGRWSNWSYTNTLTITILSSPKNAEHLTDTTPTLKWQSAGIGAQYEVQVDRIGGDFSTPVFTYSGTAKSIASTELAGGDYQWRARSNAGGGWSGWTPVWTFTITPPTTTAPALISPANDAHLDTITPAFAWNPVLNGVTYQIQISVNSSFKTPVQDVTLPASVLIYTADPLADGGTYYWRVRAINTEGVAGAWSAKWVFTLNQLVKPVQISPVTGTQMFDTTPPLTWNLVTGAVSYEVQIDKDSKFGTPDQVLTTSATSVTANPPLPDGKYYWRVRAVNAFDVTGLWSAVWNFTVDTTGPDQPVLKSPADHAGTVDTTPTLTWKSAKTATQYHVVVASDAGFAHIEVEVTVGGTSYTVLPGEALGYGLHYWQVQAADALGNWGAWSTPFQFAITNMTSPKDGTTTTATQPTFAWAAVPGALTYQFELDNDANFSSPVNTYNGPNRSYKPPLPLAAGVYYWHVSVDSGAWMPTWTVVITPAKPGKPVLSSPANNALFNDNTPLFAWLTVLNANTYQIQVDNNTDFSSPEQDVTVGVGLLSYISEELADGKYFWHVRAFNVDSAPGPWSAKWSFTIDTVPTAVPILLAPIDGAVSTNKMLKLTWNKVEGASGYELRLDLSDTFPLPIISAANKTTYTPPTPLSRGVYYWQVRALDKAGNPSNWSPVWTFEIVAGVTAPIVETPTPVPTEPPAPTTEPTAEPTTEPTVEPIIITPEPTVEPTVEPIIITPEPTVEPTVEPPPPDTALPTVTLPVSETFESKAGWQAKGVWKFGKQSGQSGGGYFADSTRRGVTSVLIAPVMIDLTGAQTPMLHFWQRMGLSSGDLAAVDVSTDGGQTWQPLNQQPGRMADWNEQTVDLSAYHGQVIRLRFRLDTRGRIPQGEQSHGWWIDNVSVQER